MTYKDFLSESFRPLFWFGSVFSSVAIPIWILSYVYSYPFQFYGSMHFWHVHEMLFGFTVAIVVGFLNTAVKNWTGKLSYGPIILLFLVILWVVARLLFVFPSVLPGKAVMWVDLSFLVISTLFFFKNLLTEESYGHMFYVPLFLLILIFLNWMMHQAVLNHHLHEVPRIGFAAVILIGHLILTVSGRTLPMFTANATKTQKVVPILGLEIFIHLNFFVILAMQLNYLFALPEIQSFLVFLYVGLNLFKSLRIKPWLTWRLPLLWTLHLSAYMVICGFLLLGLYELALFSNKSLSVHAITVGGIGLMSLSMMTRVSLGHTGRPIQADTLITLSLLLCIFAFIFRVILSVFFERSYDAILTISAICWGLAFLFYFIGFSSKLFQKRHYEFVLPIKKKA